MGKLKWASLVLAMAAGELSAYGQQPLSCYAYSATPPNVRAEGVAELAGDLLINCTGGTPTPFGQPVPQVNLQMFYNVDVTNRIPATGFADALLLADEPGSATNPKRLVCGTPYSGVCSINGTGTGRGVYNGSPGRPNVFQARYSGLNSLTWVGVPIDPPGSTGVRILRMANVRLHSNQLGPVMNPPRQLTGTVTSYGPNPLPVSTTPVVLGFASHGLQFAAGNPPAFEQCVAENQALYKDPNQNGTPQLRLTYAEGFANAFKPRTIAPYLNADISPAPYPQNVPGVIWNSETGYFDPTFPDVSGLGNVGAAGLADQGTRLMAKFSGVPRNVKLFGQAVIANAQFVARMITVINLDGSGVFSPTPHNVYGIAEIPVNSNGEPTAIYEVLRANPQQVESASIPVYVAYDTPAPAAAAVTVSGSFGPLATVLQASEFAPLARFVASTTPPVISFGIGKCANKGMNGSSTAIGSSGAPVLTAFDLRCDIGASSQSLTFSWAGRSFVLGALTSVLCGNDININPGIPKTLFDTITGVGTGTYNGSPGATATFTFQDAGEPGVNVDRVQAVVKDGLGNTVLNVSGTITVGNHQAHN